MHWKRHAGEGRRAQGDPGQLAIDQVHIDQSCAGEVRARQAAAHQPTAGDVGASQVRAAEVGLDLEARPLPILEQIFGRGVLQSPVQTGCDRLG